MNFELTQRFELVCFGGNVSVDNAICRLYGRLVV